LPASSTVYRNADGTGSITTSNAYTWVTGTRQLESITTTNPTVTTSQNGSNTASSDVVVLNNFQQPIWIKDAAGYITYRAYDQATKALVKLITDVDTMQTSTFSNLPSGWSTPSGGGMHLTTSYEVDSLGRATKVTYPNGRLDYAVYKDASHEVRRYLAWDATTNVPLLPIQVSRQDWTNGYTENITLSATPAVTGGKPTGTESLTSLESLSRAYTNTAGQVISQDAYFNLTGLTYSTSTTLGTENTHFYRTVLDYDQRGRQNKVQLPTGTVYRTYFDGLGRQASQWVGLDDTPTSGLWSPTNTTGTDLVKVSENEYDGGGVGDSNLTKVTQIPGGSAANRVTQNFFDWRNRVVATKSGVETSEATDTNRLISYVDYDNLNRVTTSRLYDGDAVSITSTSGVPNAPSSSLLRAKSETQYDERGQVYKTLTYSVDPSSGSVSSSALVNQSWFDSRGLLIKQSSPGGLVTKVTYDGVGRPTASYTTDGGGDSAYTDADDVTGDAVLQQVETTYDNNSHAILITAKQRFHDETGTGALGTASTGVKARVTYAASYYDGADRLTGVVDVGSNGGSSYTRPSSAPSRSDTVLVTTTAYNSAGLAWKLTDPRGIETRSTFDALGRVTKTIENYVDGVVSDTDDKTTEFTYNAVGRTTVKVNLPSSGQQVTEWVYGVTTAGGSGLNSNDLVKEVRYPDPSTGASSSSSKDVLTVNALGQPLTMTDRNGTVHTYSYDVLGRQTADAVTTLGSGVDGMVRRLVTAYNTQGNAYLFTAYDASSGGSMVNQVKRDFNGLGQLTSEWQSHSGAVTGSSPRVQYAYSEMAGGANHSRLTGMTYASGYTFNYNYASGLDANISRLSSLSDASNTLEAYSYLGLGTVVKRAHSQPGVDLSYIKLSTESVGDAGDQYTGLDRFGRVVDQRWINGSGTDVDRYQYGYDRDGNRLYKDNKVLSSLSEVYTYDSLNQIASYKLGTLNSGKTDVTGSPTTSQSWDYDAVGNWDSITTNSTTQTRSANLQNEITAVSGATTPTYDSNGNLTTDENNYRFVYDAWNRVIQVKNSSNVVIVTYGRDALHRHVTDTVGSTVTDRFFSNDWQLLETKVGTSTVTRNVWSPVYVDGLVLRDRDTDANGTLDERLYALQDANWNTTALVNPSGTVQERYTYTPFGQVTFRDSTGSTLSNSAKEWIFLHQDGERIAAGDYEFRNRVYSPSLGRWLSNDPLGFEAGDQNWYRAIGNNPGNGNDTNGLQRGNEWKDLKVTYKLLNKKKSDYDIMGRIVFMPEYKEKGLKASAVQKMLEDALQDYFGKYDNITIRKKINCPEGWTKGKGEKVDINNDVTGFTLHYSLERKLIFGEWKISFILDPSIISNQNDLGKANIFGNFKEIITGQAGPCEKKGACGSIDLEQRI
jgi:RHS repeat-associated protein